LRNVLAYLAVLTLSQPQVFIEAKGGLFDSDGIIGPDSTTFLQGWMDRFRNSAVSPNA
jgi:chromate reductase